MRVTATGEAVIAGKLDAVEAAQEEIVAPLPDQYRAVFLQSLRILVGLADRGEDPPESS
jgi:hypothetical protein